MTEYWFRPKRYGYGASPANWKGWLATLIFLAIVAGLQVAIQPVRTQEGLAEALGSTAIALAVFAWIVWKKTEGSWRWRWGPEGQDK